MITLPAPCYSLIGWFNHVTSLCILSSWGMEGMTLTVICAWEQERGRKFNLHSPSPHSPPSTSPALLCGWVAADLSHIVIVVTDNRWLILFTTTTQLSKIQLNIECSMFAPNTPLSKTMFSRRPSWATKKTFNNNMVSCSPS